MAKINDTSIPEGYKRCSKGADCKHPDGPILPATTEYFYRAKKGLYSLAGYCKVCASKIQSEKHFNARYDPVAELNKAAGLKCCTQCKTWKPATAEFFCVDNRLKSGLHSWCRECSRLQQKNDPARQQKRREYYQKNREHERETNRQYIKAHAEEIKERTAKYRKTEAFKASKRKHRYKPEVYARDMERAKVRYHVKRRGTIRVPSELTHELWQKALGYFGGRCAICGRPPGLWHTLAIDHWVPVAKGGSSSVGNIVPLCHGVDGCNNSKKDKLPMDWLIERFGKRKARKIHQRIEEYFEWILEQAITQEAA